jgi:hypothetical protein
VSSTNPRWTPPNRAAAPSDFSTFKKRRSRRPTSTCGVNRKGADEPKAIVDADTDARSRQLAHG